MGITRQFVYRVNLDPTIGHEIDKERPCLVISPTAFNNNSGLVTIVPLTDRKVGTIHSNQVEVTVADGCVDKLSKIKVDQIRTLDASRIGREMGKLPADKYKRVKEILKKHLNID